MESLETIIIMKLQEVAEQPKKGTYSAVKFDDQTINKIKAYVDENNIPNALDPEKYHTTVTYSRKFLPDLKPVDPIDPPWIGTPEQLEVWKSQPDENGETSNCLVLKYKCDQLTDRHNQIMDDHGATYDFPDYKAHITLSYDIGDMDHSQLPDVKDIGDIVINKEYVDELNLNWSKENS